VVEGVVLCSGYARVMRDCVAGGYTMLTIVCGCGDGSNDKTQTHNLYQSSIINNLFEE